MPNQIGPGYPGTPMQPGLQEPTADLPPSPLVGNDREILVGSDKEHFDPNAEPLFPPQDTVDGSFPDDGYLDGGC
jgi:hypothetical protein